MEGINRHLGHKQKQKNSSDLKETLHINQVTETRPRPGHAGGGCKSNQGAPNQSRRAHLQKHQRRFHSFATDRQGRE